MSADIPAGHYLDTEHGIFSAACYETEGAPCRNGCELPCAAWENGDGCDHPKTRPLGYCNVTEWLNADGVEESFDRDAPTHLFPIAPRWDGEHFVWTFAEEAPR